MITGVRPALSCIVQFRQRVAAVQNGRRANQKNQYVGCRNRLTESLIKVITRLQGRAIEEDLMSVSE
jgi:hypothetical protein